MNRKIWIVTLHKGKGKENIIKSFSEYPTALKYLEKEPHEGIASLRKVEFVDECDYQSELGDLL